ncbi:MAG: S-methyl-5-thioribose-1-phosphate isomerase [Anaerovoracaceae bacterium]|jgi:methylthioribose-1-phosphate isomerase
MIEISPLKYSEDSLWILDQTKLPQEEDWLRIETAEDLWDGIHELRVRGAPAIGVAAAIGTAVLARGLEADNEASYRAAWQRLRDYIAGSRPTAVNLFWALDRMTAALQKALAQTADRGQNRAAADRHDAADEWPRRRRQVEETLLREALAVRDEDEAACRQMGEYGLELLQPGMGLLTHCNAGALATAKYGTALAPIHLGQERGYGFHVYADETRPLLQGARLTAWELHRAGVDVTLLCDNMAASLMQSGRIDAVLVGCDRMAANGDGANKIGTSAVAMLAAAYHIPFYMFVPSSTIDLNTPTGAEIEIEQRDGAEIYRKWYARDMAPAGIKTYNPAFDVTDHRYITAVITERGIVRPPFSENLAGLFTDARER